MTVKLIDLYSGNNFNPAKIIADGYTGVIFKAGQGGWADCPRYHPTWWQQAKDAGLLVGWYWLCDSRYHSSYHIKEMENWKIFDDVGQLGLWVDMEKPMIAMTEAAYWKTPYAGHKNVVDFVYLIGEHGINPGIYTGPGAYELIMRGAPKTAHDYLSTCDLWTAQYPYVYVSGVSKPKVYGSWTTWNFWQYREGPDINIFNGGDEEFYMKYGGYISPPTPPDTGEPPMPVPQIPTVVGKARSATNIKTVDGVPSGAVASLPVDGLIYGDWNAGKTDIMYGRSKDGLKNGFYRPTGEFVEWIEPIKAGATNLTVTSYTSIPIPPDPDPTPVVWPPSFILEDEITHARQRYIKE